MTIAARLAENPIFADASPDALAALVIGGELRDYAPGAMVLTEGEPARHLFVLVSGLVRVYHAIPSGDEIVLKIFRAPAIFGEAEALSGLRFVENVCAVDAAQAIALPIEAVVAFLAGSPLAALRLLGDVSLRLAIAAYHEKTLAFHPVTVRLANHLLDHLEASGEAHAATPRLALNQDQMASAIGATRRSIAKDVIGWQKDGVLAKDDGGYLVRDLPALRRYADPQRLPLTHAMRSAEDEGPLARILPRATKK